MRSERIGWESDGCQKDGSPLGMNAGHGFFVTLSALQPLIENVPRFDPLLCFFIHLAGIGFEDDSFAGTEQAGVHALLETFGKFSPVIMSVFLMMKIDVDLGTP